MVTEEVAKSIKVIYGAAMRNGWDFAEVLAKSGLLLTGSLRKDIEAAVLDLLIYQLEQQQPTTFQKLGGGQPTVADGVNGVIEFVKMYRKMFD